MTQDTHYAAKITDNSMFAIDTARYPIRSMHSVHVELTPHKTEVVVNKINDLLHTLNIGDSVAINITIQRVSEDTVELGTGFVKHTP